MIEIGDTAFLSWRERRVTGYAKIVPIETIDSVRLMDELVERKRAVLEARTFDATGMLALAHYALLRHDEAVISNMAAEKALWQIGQLS